MKWTTFVLLSFFTTSCSMMPLYSPYDDYRVGSLELRNISALETELELGQSCEQIRSFFSIAPEVSLRAGSQLWHYQYTEYAYNNSDSRSYKYFILFIIGGVSDTEDSALSGRFPVDTRHLYLTFNQDCQLTDYEIISSI